MHSQIDIDPNSDMRNKWRVYKAKVEDAIMVILEMADDLYCLSPKFGDHSFRGSDKDAEIILVINQILLVVWNV